MAFFRQPVLGSATTGQKEFGTLLADRGVLPQVYLDLPYFWCMERQKEQPVYET
jgi:hypothetical protein